MTTWCDIGDVVKVLLIIISIWDSPGAVLKIKTDQSGSKIKPKRRPTSFHEIEAFKKNIYRGLTLPSFYRKIGVFKVWENQGKSQRQKQGTNMFLFSLDWPKYFYVPNLKRIREFVRDVPDKIVIFCRFDMKR